MMRVAVGRFRLKNFSSTSTTNPWGVVVIQQDDLVQRWLFDLRPELLDDYAGVGTERGCGSAYVLYMGRQTATQACHRCRGLLNKTNC